MDEGALVWIPDKDHAWLPGIVSGRAGGGAEPLELTVTVQTALIESGEYTGPESRTLTLKPGQSELENEKIKHAAASNPRAVSPRGGPPLTPHHAASGAPRVASQAARD